MPRPVDPNSQYRVAIHTINGYRYASTQPFHVDPKSGKKVYRHIHWGTVDENDKFIPGKNYLLASLTERSKLIFPKSWDLSEIKKLSGERKKGSQVIESQGENRLYGDIWLLEKISDATGIRKDLLKTFDDNRETVDSVLTLAFFLLSGKANCEQPAAWQQISKTPSSIQLTSSYIARLTRSITDADRMTLLRLRASGLSAGELCAVDSAVSCAWGEGLPDIRYGRGKDKLPLPQTSEVVVYTRNDHMPVYYRSFPGNVPDSSGLENILQDLENAGFQDVALITDRGYESIKNLELYIDRKQRMIMGTKISQAHVRRQIDAFGEFSHRPEGMEIDMEERVYYQLFELAYQIGGGRGIVRRTEKLKLNLYFDPMRRSQELIDLDIAVKEQGNALEEIRTRQLPLDDDTTINQAYCFYILEYDAATRILKSYVLNEKKLSSTKREAGFFSNTTYRLDIDAVTALHHYSLLDEQERYFAVMTGILDADRQDNTYKLGKIGVRFVLFVAHVIGCYLSYIWKNKLNDRFRSEQDVLNEMRPIRYIEHPGAKPYITPFIGKQLDICEAFGFGIPDGCSLE